MRIIKKLHSTKLLDKATKKEITKNLPNYFIEADNGKMIMVKPVFVNDYKALDFISVFVRSETENDHE